MSDDKLGMLHGLLVKFAPILGLNKEEAEWFWTQAADVLHDVRVVVHGGTFRDGTSFVGVKTIVPEVNRHGQAIEALLLRVDGKPVEHADSHGDAPARKKAVSR
jgi:hypothetical protein